MLLISEQIFESCVRICLTFALEAVRILISLHFSVLGRIACLQCIRCGVAHWLVAWHSGRTSVFCQRTFPVICSTCSWGVTIYVGKLSAIGETTRPTQPFIPCDASFGCTVLIVRVSNGVSRVCYWFTWLVVLI